MVNMVNKMNSINGRKFPLSRKEFNDKFRYQIRQLYEKRIVTKVYLAKPYLNSSVGAKNFRLVRDAVKYLNNYTGFNMYDVNKNINTPTMKACINNTV